MRFGVRGWIGLALMMLVGTFACVPLTSYQRGNRALDRGAYADAVRLYQEALANDPTDPQLRNNLGVAYLRLNQDDRAFGEFQKILAQNPRDAKAHFNLGLVYYKKRLFDQEIQEYLAALNLDPDHFQAHLNLGHAYLARGRDADAAHEYEWILNRNPDQLAAIYNLALLYADHGRTAEAEALLKRYLKLEPRPDWTEKARRRLQALGTGAIGR